MEERPVRPDLHIVDNARFEIRVDGTGNVFSGSGLGKESGEPVLSCFRDTFLDTAVRLTVSRELAAIMKETREDTHTQTMLESVKFPFCVITFTRSDE